MATQGYHLLKLEQLAADTRLMAIAEDGPNRTPDLMLFLNVRRVWNRAARDMGQRNPSNRVATITVDAIAKTRMVRVEHHEILNAIGVWVEVKRFAHRQTTPSPHAS